ncbi:ABC transporter substrate-binding protein [Microbaculum marinum]|uniref:Extracellular solute-binding protein n=1 Tax=Microbaculum marinum TaxID=1764581 RepID=A0AAW9RP19_9HYPH
MKRSCAVFANAVSASVLALVALSVPASAATFEEILEGARNEGQLFVLVSSPGKPETHKAVADAFNERFGLDTQIEWTATNPVQTGTKLIAEQGGAGFVDVIGAGGNQEMAALVERDILKPYPWKETFGGELDNIGAAVDPVIDDLKGDGLLIAHNVYGLGWNPDLISEDELPDSYADLMDPEWKGRFAVNAYSLNPVDYYSFDLGDEKTMEMAKGILDNEPILERGTGAVTRAISVGQAPVGISSFHQAGRVENVNFKLFDDYVPVGVLHVYVPENAPNPNTARLFAAWFATDGIKIVNEIEPLPRIGEGSDLDKMLEDVKAGGGKVLTETSLEDTGHAAEMRNKIADQMTQ